jgi:hypothetical protein
MSPLIKPSTRAFFREARRIPGYPLLEWLHGYFYLRFTYFYIGNAMGVRFPANLFNRLAQFWHHIFTRRQHPPQPGGITFADTYHGKVVPLETARQLVLVREEIRINYPEQVLPYALARDLILKQPDHIVALACPCRTARPQPCLPLDVCLIVGEPFASLVMEHHANRAHWVTSQTALDILGGGTARACAPCIFQTGGVGAVLCHLQLLLLLLWCHAGSPTWHPHAGILRLHQPGKPS